ncbi:Plant UBX domain-containing protein 5 [Citrus sinensis]|uniref:UBX domain-containing protein n=3 Tax=Citrus TaxID=2706 RepID=V4TK88_CITCL|nr:plant UBX domain-containing protein 4 [Citrus x clementina]XP_006469631.1 plant UBX domain-containing protein 4 [Citrus sinensis]ESR60863.1 hypothetical protein CICLE_v10015438mg [Citrus x clementina]KAH9744905.1 Plant UBX domain-containing protein 5 [Citrus sinensis]
MEKPTAEANSSLINSFVEITSSTKDEALFFLESHQWNLDAAVSTFLDNAAAATASPEASQSVATLPAVNSPSLSNSPSTSPSASLSRSPSRSRSPSPAAARDPYELRSRSRPGKKEDKKAATGTSRGGIRTLADLNRTPPGGADSDDDDDEPQQYYTGGEKSGMLVQDPTKGNQVDEIFNQARQSAVERPDLRASSSSKAFTGTARLLSGETVSSAPAPPPENVSHNITFWRNGFTVDDGPLRGMDDPANASFLESIMRSECPRELEPADKKTRVHVELINKREEDYSEPPKRRSAFQGVGRTLGGSDSPASAALNTAPSPSSGLVVDATLPTTSVQLRLADGTRMVARFNHHHTIRDIHRFIDASRPGSARNYQLQAMGFPPKQLTDLDQTVEQAGIANSVVIQKL